MSVRVGISLEHREVYQAPALSEHGELHRRSPALLGRWHQSTRGAADQDNAPRDGVALIIGIYHVSGELSQVFAPSQGVSIEDTSDAEGGGMHDHEGGYPAPSGASRCDQEHINSEYRP